MASSKLSMLFALVLAIGMVVAAPTPAPHKGMIDQPHHRDTGIIFSESDYQGSSHLLVEDDLDNHCYQLKSEGELPGAVIGSVQICKPAVCTFFASSKCWDSEGDNYRITTNGPGDLPVFRVPEGVAPRFQSYICGEQALAGQANVNLQLTPNRMHD